MLRLLWVRLGALTFAQLLVMGALASARVAEPVWTLAAWWPISGALANLLTYVGLRRAHPHDVKVRARDLPTNAIVTALLTVAPASGMAWWLWGDATPLAALLGAPLPPLALLVAWVVYPISVARVEIPMFARPLTHAAANLPLPPAARVALAGALLCLPILVWPFVPAMEFTQWRAVAGMPLAWGLARMLTREPSRAGALAIAHAGVMLIAALWSTGVLR